MKERSIEDYRSPIPPKYSTVYRDGHRIRDSKGTGYVDDVSDREIRAHIIRRHDDFVFVAFAEAVLAIRKYERLSTY